MDFNEKIVKAKQAMARRGRGDSGREVDEDYGDDRVPPGQHLVNNWPVLDLGYKPNVSLEEWALTIDGEVTNSVIWNWKDFQSQPQVKSHSDFHCVTSWSRLDNDWEGVSFKHLIEVVQPLPTAKFVLLRPTMNTRRICR